MRKKRLRLFQSLIEQLPKPARILDVGGTQQLWEYMELCDNSAVHIVLLNLKEEPTTCTNIRSVIADARDMSQFSDREFDAVFSNSVIEHVGDYDDQRRMANEVMRLSKRYFVQTPNYYFPLEPHFLLPFFQFLPMQMRAWLALHANPGWYKVSSRQEALELVRSIQLLRKQELLDLFPNATLFEEKFLGLTKSFIVYSGWN